MSGLHLPCATCTQPLRLDPGGWPAPVCTNRECDAYGRPAEQGAP